MAKDDATKTDATPESTWGATEAAKKAWDSKHGKDARKAPEDTPAKDEK